MAIDTINMKINGSSVLVIDDHDLFRKGICMALKADISDIRIIDFGNLKDAIDIQDEDIDLILLDYKLGKQNGLDGIERIKSKWQKSPVIVLSAFDEPATVSMAFKRGADSFISKSESAEKIVSKIKQILHGRIPLVSDLITERPRLLTVRQQEVLALLQEGLSNKLIAQRLSLSINTVRRHVQDILLALNVKSRAEAVYTSRVHEIN